MSAALVRKSLAVVDPDFNKSEGKNRTKKVKNVIDLIPQNHKITRKIKKGKRAVKINLLKHINKFTVTEARQKIKSKDQILKENLEKLKLIREACKIDLDQRLTNQIFERGRTKRPVKASTTKKQEKKTAFTEEDFKRFEEEYFDE